MKNALLISTLLLIGGIVLAYQPAQRTHFAAKVQKDNYNSKLHTELVNKISSTIDYASRNGEFDTEIFVSDYPNFLIREEIKQLVRDGYHVKFITNSKDFNPTMKVLNISW